MSASRAGLTRVGRVHFHDVPSSFFCFDNQPGEEHRPRGIGEGFREAGILDHVAHDQRFDSAEAEAGNELTHCLFDEGFAPVGNPFMGARDDLALLFARFCALGGFQQLALRAREFRLFLTEKARGSNGLPCAQRRKRGESDINAAFFL
jgi:hypothetical protein